MYCPTCCHTLECVCNESLLIHNCPRCGTMTVVHFADPDNVKVYVPKLVERCQRFEEEMTKENIGQYYRNQWTRLGIKESIHRPEDRK